MRSVSILGISLTDCSLRESLARMNLFLQDGAMNAVLYVNTPLLLAAGQSDNLRAWVEHVDMTVCGDLGLLWSYGITSVSRVRETQRFTFLRETLEKLAHTGNTVYLIADSPDALSALRADVTALQEGLAIVGEGIFEESDDVNDRTINDINRLLPAVILMRTSYGFARRFMVDDKPLVNARVVIAFPKELEFAAERESVLSKGINGAYRLLFRRRLARYEKDQSKKNSQK